MPGSESQLLTTTSFTEYFRETVSSAMHNQHVEADEHTEFYLVSLLESYARSDQFYDATEDGMTLRPLAEVYGDAVNASTPEQRDTMLRRLGDVALFVAGVFAESGQRRGINVDYYINMGGSAYSVLSESDKISRMYMPLVDTFDELARKFISFVDVLAEVSESANLSSDSNTLRVYDYWQRTGSERARQQLSEAGIVPIHAKTLPSCH